MVEQYEAMEKEEDADQANFDGMMGAFMKSVINHKKSRAAAVSWLDCCPVFYKSSVLHVLHHVLPSLLYVGWDLQVLDTYV